MSDDAINNLAVGLAEDHKAAKRRAKAPAAAKAGDEAQAEAVAAGSTDDEAAALAEVVTDAVDDAIENDQAANPVADRIERIGATADLRTATLVGDVRDTLLDLFRTRPKPWGQLTAEEQQQVAAALAQAARSLVADTVKLVTDAGDGAFMAKLEKYADGGGLKINLTAESTTDNVLACHAAQGQFVIVRRYDPKPFDSERAPVYIDEDQTMMGFDGGEGTRGDEPATDDQIADPFARDAGDNGGFGG